MIKREDVTKIMDAIKIEDVIGAFVPLKKRGVNYIGLCPFHDEKTPSFNVNPVKGIFKCFGCGEGGSAISFLMKHQHYTYYESLKWLADFYHIKIEETELSEEEKQERSERDRLFHANEFAQRYFQDILFNDPEGVSVGLSYFEERCITKETIKRWGLGYCKNSWTDFCDAALREGFTMEELANAGVVVRNEEKKSYYDRFKARVTFPIYNIGGRVLGFSARILSSDKSKAKYVNSPESLIYSKSRVLFGLHLAKESIAKEDLCYLVEGNMDAIMMNQCGVCNVVATSGTALTEPQIALIKRYTRNVTVLYDGDNAGIKATFKAVNLFLEQGLNVRTVLFPDGDDPDSFARKHTRDEFKAFLENNSQNFILYKTNLLLQQAEGDPVRRAELIKDIVHTISLVPDMLERSTYIQQCSSVLQVDEATLAKALKDQLRKNAVNKAKQQAKEESFSQTDVPITEHSNLAFSQQKDKLVENPDYEKEKEIISILLKYGEEETNQDVYDESGVLEKKSIPVAMFVVCDIANDDVDFNDELFAKVFAKYKKSIYENQTIPSAKEFIYDQDDRIRRLAAGILVDGKTISPRWPEKNVSVPKPEDQDRRDQHIFESLLSFKLDKINSYIDKINEKISKTTDPDKSSELLRENKRLTDLRNKIAAILKRVFAR